MKKGEMESGYVIWKESMKELRSKGRGDKWELRSNEGWNQREKGKEHETKVGEEWENEGGKDKLGSKGKCEVPITVSEPEE